MTHFYPKMTLSPRNQGGLPLFLGETLFLDKSRAFFCLFYPKISGFWPFSPRNQGAFLPLNLPIFGPQNPPWFLGEKCQIPVFLDLLDPILTPKWHFLRKTRGLTPFLKVPKWQIRGVSATNIEIVTLFDRNRPRKSMLCSTFIPG